MDATTPTPLPHVAGWPDMIGNVQHGWRQPWPALLTSTFGWVWAGAGRPLARAAFELVAPLMYRWGRLSAVSADHCLCGQSTRTLSAMSIVWTEATEDLWSRYLNHLESVGVHHDYEPDELPHAIEAANFARAALFDHLEQINAHPATLPDDDRDLLVGRLIELGARPRNQVGEGTVRRAVADLVPDRRPARWSVEMYGDPVAAGVPVTGALETQSRIMGILEDWPIENPDVTIDFASRHLYIGFGIPLQPPAQARDTATAVVAALRLPADMTIVGYSGRTPVPCQSNPWS